MYPWYTAYKPGFNLRYDDIHGIQSLYGKDPNLGVIGKKCSLGNAFYQTPWKCAIIFSLIKSASSINFFDFQGLKVTKSKKKDSSASKLNILEKWKILSH